MEWQVGFKREHEDPPWMPQAFIANLSEMTSVMSAVFYLFEGCH